MSGIRWAVLAAGAIAALAGASYASGWLVLQFLGLDTRLLGLETYLGYLRALDLPQVAPYGGRIRAAGWLGSAVPMLAYGGLVYLAVRPARQSLHGEARFASVHDVARRGLFRRDPAAIVIGRMGRRLVRLGGQQFAILAAPTRSGKGVGLVVPNLLEYGHSVVVLDIKQENFALTSGWRARMGHDVFMFNPFAEDRRSHRWNPLGYVSADPAFRVSDLQGIATMLYPERGSEQAFWVGHARNAFLAFALYLFENLDDQRAAGFPQEAQHVPTLGMVYRLSSGDGIDMAAHLRDLSQRPFLGAEARLAFASLLSQAPETFASILGTCREPLNAWVNPVLDAATSANDFLLTDLRRRRTTIYVGVQPNRLAEARTILNLFFSQLIHLNTKDLPSTDAALKYQCLLLMDEFTAIGRIDIIASAVAYMAGYNLRLLPIIQSMAQLDAVYGKEVARTILTNHALQILFAPREQQDADDYSEMLGYTTVRKDSRTRQRGWGRDGSISESDERRALMLPQELKAMGQTRQIFLYEGIPHPVRCDKIRYYQERRFRVRLLPPVQVPVLPTWGSSRKEAVDHT